METGQAASPALPVHHPLAEKGSADGGWDAVLALIPYVLLSSGTLSLSGHALNVMQFAEEQARSLGEISRFSNFRRGRTPLA